MRKKIYLVTGFLGSGKTTFLQNLLTQLVPRHKIGVIVNEFGRAGIDGSLIASRELELHELSGGSIFCACLKGNFVAALDAFLDLPIEYLFIESSGLSDPAGFHKLSSFINKNACIQSIATLCIIDAKYFLDQLDMFNSVETQICSADLILINKVDLVSNQQLCETKTIITALNPGARLEQMQFGNFDCAAIHGLHSSKSTLPANEHPDLRPFTHTLIASCSVSVEQLRNFLTALVPLALRIKGFIHTEIGVVKIDVVGKTINIVEYPAAVSTQLVIIANRALPINREISSAWQSHCPGEIALI